MSTAVPPGGIDACHAQGPAWRDYLLALTGILILSDAFDAALYRAFGRFTEVLPGLPVSRTLLLPVFVAAALLLVADRRGAARCVRAAWPLWPALALACASTVWSDVPRTTLLWSAAVLGTSAFGVALATRFSPRAQSELVAAAAAAVALASIVVGLCWPAFGISDRRRELRGLLVHKNLLGRSMALGVAAAAAATIDGRRRALAVGAALLCGAVILASQSRASLLVAVLVLTAIGVLLAARTWPRHAVAIVAGGAAVTMLGLAFLLGTKPGLALVERSETFSGRTKIWRRVIGLSAPTPWLGHGYAAFWPGPAGREAVTIVRPPIGHAHNGFVDCYAELGIVGLALVCLPLVVFTVGACRHAVRPGARACLWPAGFLLFFVASNLAESSLLRHKLGWALYVAVVCHLATHRPSAERRQRLCA